MDTRSALAAIAGLLLLGAVAGCATEIPARSQAPVPGSDACVFQSNVRGWKVLDDQTLLVEAPAGGSRFLIKLFHPATGLGFQETLGFEDGDGNGQLCGTGDSLRLATPVPQTVPITAVRSLTVEESNALLAPKPQ